MANFIESLLHEELDNLLSNELKLEILEDESAWHPREDDCSAGIVCVSNKCKYLTNEELSVDFDRYNFKNWSSVAKWLRANKGAIEVLPIYIYDHSGITINTTGFCGSGEYGQIGVYYTTAKRFQEYISDDLSVENIKHVLVEEIRMFDKYLSGEVYAYKITNKLGATLEYCGNYYGYDEAENGGKDVLKSYQVQYNDEITKLKTHMASIQELPFITA